MKLDHALMSKKECLHLATVATDLNEKDKNKDTYPTKLN